VPGAGRGRIPEGCTEAVVVAALPRGEEVRQSGVKLGVSFLAKESGVISNRMTMSAWHNCLSM